MENGARSCSDRSSKIEIDWMPACIIRLSVSRNSMDLTAIPSRCQPSSITIWTNRAEAVTGKSTTVCWKVASMPEGTFRSCPSGNTALPSANAIFTFLGPNGNSWSETGRIKTALSWWALPRSRTIAWRECGNLSKSGTPAGVLVETTTFVGNEDSTIPSIGNT